MHALQLAHADLKPENILLVQTLDRGGSGGGGGGGLPPRRVALIDFGGATWHSDHRRCVHAAVPAAEVTLGLEWGVHVDMWSMGCILAELWTGSLLFSTHDEVEHLALMERTLGALPRAMLLKRAEKNFRHGYLRWPERAMDRESEARAGAAPAARLPGDRPARRADGVGGAALEFHDVISRCLEYIPAMRLAAGGDADAGCRATAPAPHPSSSATNGGASGASGAGAEHAGAPPRRRPSLASAAGRRRPRRPPHRRPSLLCEAGSKRVNGPAGPRHGLVRTTGMYIFQA